jgi:ribosome biogenesis protein Nip4
MKPLHTFIQRLNSNLHLKKNLVIESRNRWYLLTDTLKRSVDEAFVHAGTYLGKLKGRTFFPSISLLAMIAQTRANKTTVNEKTEWLFICGRDIFEEGILTTEGSKKTGDLTIILNQHGECLGLGRITRNITGEGSGRRVAIRRVLDIGDFLRRERQ